ncbi:hypothetical protein PWT90_02433 [Aphanocladium album]|nr:hypothetical protein PWT90_02433 [Aphanocladium album]
MPEPESYTIGWLCALKTEHVAARAFLDEEHHQDGFVVPPNDNNAYTRGRLGEHNVAIAILPESEYGIAAAACVARDMMHTFCNIRICLMVGIGGGVPSKRHDIRLGDVVVSLPQGGRGAVLQYDFGKSVQNQSFKLTGYLNQPPTVLRTAIAQIRSHYDSDGHNLEADVKEVLQRKPRLQKEYGRPESCSDRLYHSAIAHPEEHADCATVCGDGQSKLVSREARTELENNPAIHYGLIASANRLMKNALVRDKLASEFDVLCFEMEAAGLMNHTPCLVIRGICDYSDSHKNNVWQGYAAMVAAAYTKDLLRRIAPNRIMAERKLGDILSDVHEVTKQVLATTLKNQEVAEQHLDIAKTRLLDEKRKQLQKCHQLFRLTHDSKDITYEFYKNLVQERVVGTCAWVLQHEHFHRWLTQEAGILLITANPGCGKSVLARYLLEHCLPKSATVCYFFFQDGGQNTVKQALCALLHQLFTHKTCLLEHAMKEYHKDGSSLVNSTESLGMILRSVLQDPRCGTVIAVLDALDECAESQLTELIRHLARLGDLKGPGKLKCILTSRPYRQVVSALHDLGKGFPIARISGEDESETISREVDLVITHRINKLPTRQDDQGQGDGLSPQLKKHLETRLQETKHRTYLWVYLVFEHLRERDFRKTTKGIDEALATLPKTVDEAYERILCRSKGDSMVRKALCVLLAAIRPLTVSEMNVSMSIDAEARSTEDLDLENDEDFKTRLRSWCGLFVIIEQGRVYFLHQTAREFLLVNLTSPATRPSGLRWQHSITVFQAHTVLAEACMLYLRLAKYNMDGDVQAMQKQTFFNYSAIWWATHLWEAGKGAGVSNYNYAQQICDKSSDCYLAWSKAYDEWKFTPPIPPIKFNGAEHLTDALSCKTSFRDGLDIADIHRIIDDGHAFEAWEETPPLRNTKRREKEVTRLPYEKGASLPRSHALEIEKLATAAEKGVLELAKSLLDMGVSSDGASRLGTPLPAAIKAGNRDMTRLLLKHNANPDLTTSLDNTPPLLIAVEMGDKAIVRLLLDHNAAVDLSGSGKRPLAMAVEKGQRDISELLLRRGATIADPGYYYSLLSVAIERNDLSMVELLLQYGAVAKPQYADQTPLSLAAQHGQVAMVKQLIAQGADLNADYSWTAPLSLAAQNGHESTVELLVISGADRDPEVFGRTPLSRAAENGHEGVVNVLLAGGASVDARDYESLRLLPYTGKINRAEVKLVLDKVNDIRASDEKHKMWSKQQHAHENLAKLLLKNGRNPRADNGEYNQTPLIWATKGGHRSVIETLLQNGADIEARDSTGRTSLAWAAKNGNKAVIELLLVRGANLETRDAKYGQTPLVWAIDNGHEEVVRQLLEADADLEVVDDAYNQTPLAWAFESGNETVIRLLLNKGANPRVTTRFRTPLVWAAENGVNDVLELLLQRGADVEDDVLLQTPLTWAAENGNTIAVRALLDHGANIEAGAPLQTPLGCASMKGHEAVVDLLLSRSAKVDAKTANRTPLSHAAESGHLAVARRLLEHGANLEAKDDELGRTPLAWAAKRGHKIVVTLLLEAGASVDPIENLGPVPKEKNKAINVLTYLWESGRDPEFSIICGPSEGWNAIVLNRWQSRYKKLLPYSSGLFAADYDVTKDEANSLSQSTPLPDTALARFMDIGKKWDPQQLFSTRNNYVLTSEKVKKIWQKSQYQLDTLHRAKSAGLLPGEPGLCLLSDVARYTKSLPMTRLLLEWGVDVNESACSGVDECLRAPLHYAVNDGCGDLVQLLLAAGADPHLHDCKGLTALHLAREEDIVKLLLQAGTKINTPSASGDFGNQAGVTPLAHHACQGNLKVVKVLLEAGADPWDASLGAPLTNILMQDERQDVLICILGFQMSVPTDSRAPRLCTLCNVELATANDWRTHAKTLITYVPGFPKLSSEQRHQPPSLSDEESGTNTATGQANGRSLEPGNFRPRKITFKDEGRPLREKILVVRGNPERTYSGKALSLRPIWPNSFQTIQPSLKQWSVIDTSSLLSVAARTSFEGDSTSVHVLVATPWCT